jgi:curved DNA-binding protein CbpA
MASKSDNKQAELEQTARDFVSRGEDLYVLLGIDATTSADDRHRAWRRRNLALHPDKAGAAFDPAKLEAVTKARDVLLDEVARRIYEGGMRAALLRRQQYEESDKKRQVLIDELNRGERAAEEAKTRSAEEKREKERENTRLAERGRQRMEERARQLREAEEREKMAAVVAKEDSSDELMVDGQNASTSHLGLDQRIAELEQRMEENRARKAKKRARRAEKKGARNGEMHVVELGEVQESRGAREEQSELTDGQPSSGASLRAVISATVARLRAKQAEIDQGLQENIVSSTAERLRAHRVATLAAE